MRDATIFSFFVAYLVLSVEYAFCNKFDIPGNSKRNSSILLHSVKESVSIFYYLFQAFNGHFQKKGGEGRKNYFEYSSS